MALLGCETKILRCLFAYLDGINKKEHLLSYPDSVGRVLFYLVKTLEYAELLVSLPEGFAPASLAFFTFYNSTLDKLHTTVLDEPLELLAKFKIEVGEDRSPNAFLIFSLFGLSFFSLFQFSIVVVDIVIITKDDVRVRHSVRSLLVSFVSFESLHLLHLLIDLLLYIFFQFAQPFGFLFGRFFFVSFRCRLLLSLPFLTFYSLLFFFFS